MSKNLKIIPADKKFKGAPPLDQKINIELEQQSLELIEGDRSVPLNLAERFNDERQNISLYRFYGKLQPYVDNAYSGQAFQTASKLFYNLYSVGNINYLQWYGYPEFREFDFIRNDVDESVSDETNWNLYITIPATCNAQQPMVYQPVEYGEILNFVAQDGIPFFINNISKGGKTLIEINCGAPHGLKVGEYVVLKIKNYPFPNNINTFPVYSIGNQKRNSEKTIFSVFIPAVNLVGPAIPQGSVGVLKRQLILNDPTSISSYYVIEHEIITNVKDYNLNKAAFAEGVFKDVTKFQDGSVNPNGKERESVKVAYPTYLYSFVEDIDVKEYLDHLKRPLTTVYVTVMLRNNRGYFEYPPRYGWTWNYPYNFADPNISSQIVRGHSGDLQPVSGIILPVPTNPSVNSGKPLQVGDRLRGAFTEYNKYELKERTISDIKHKFNFNSTVFGVIGTTGGPSYVYKPHYNVPLRVFSNYIENGQSDTVANIPSYSTYFEDEKVWKWRDIYDIGFVEGGHGVDYPFLNTTHYPKRDIDFFVHRLVRSTAFNTTVNVSGASQTFENFIIDGCE